MYIKYIDMHMDDRYAIYVSYRGSPHSIGVFPSECQWIVPGTVDPKD